MKPLNTHTVPTVVVGAGLAGLSAALSLADNRTVWLIAKRSLTEAATPWAQGGIVGVLDKNDSIESHIADTQSAGAYLVEEATARFVSSESHKAIEWLVAQGVPFTFDSTKHINANSSVSEKIAALHLTQEGGHSHRRIAHATDATGRAIHDTLLTKVRAHSNIRVFEHYIALDLITNKHLQSPPNKPAKSTLNRCYGVYVLDINTGKIETMPASEVILATGGVGKVYKYTTNPDTATGDGIAMAWRAGCRVANMEFIQFHPTCLYHPNDRTFLITEAIRGEGGYLRLPNGRRFMPDYDERAELAPRDIVARAIDVEMKKGGLDCVYLDAIHLGADFLQSHFPTIAARCLALGINITTDPIPVVPAAHYTCGGVVTDHAGSTDVAGLYAIGETAYTGLHGANRLASNSLLECVVFGHASAQAILSTSAVIPPAINPWDESQVENADEQVVIAHNWDELRSLMHNYVGIARTTRRLDRALDRIRLLRREVQEYYANFRVTRDLIELRNLLECAELIVRGALSRHESRGLHYNRDYPDSYRVAYPTVLIP